VRICLHCQSNHYPRWLIDSMARLGDRVPWIVCIDPPRTNSFPAQRTIGRLWIGGDGIEQNYINQGSHGAEQHYEVLRPLMDAARYVHVWLPVNEPRVETQADRAHLIEYFIRFCELAHADGFRVAGPCDGVGRIGNDAYLDAQGMNWIERIHYVAREMCELYQAVDYGASHNYGRRVGTEWQSWYAWTLRMSYVIDGLRVAGIEPPPWLVTEGGLDIGGGASDGWRMGPNSETYLHYLKMVEDRLPPEVQCYALYTALHTDQRWASYDGMQDFWTRFVEPWAMTLGPSVEDIIAAEAQKHIIPLNPASAFEREARKKGLLPAGHEFDKPINGIVYRGQAYRGEDRDWQYIVYTIRGDWDPAHFTWIRNKN